MELTHDYFVRKMLKPELLRKMNIYRIKFINQGKAYVMYAESVVESHLSGFICLKNLIFGQATPYGIDPEEEKLKQEFSGVSTSMIPMQSIIRIDQVERRNKNKLFKLKSDTAARLFLSPEYDINK